MKILQFAAISAVLSAAALALSGCSPKPAAVQSGTWSTTPAEKTEDPGPDLVTKATMIQLCGLADQVITADAETNANVKQMLPLTKPGPLRTQSEQANASAIAAHDEAAAAWKDICRS